jgi:short-subunit dehydrogenase
MEIEGSKVLVTGASSGIGAELAVQLAERGATVGIVGRREDRLAATLARCQEHAAGSRMWVADLGDLDRAAGVALDAWEAFGGLDCLVNNAAIPKRRAVAELTFGEVEELIRVDYLSPIRMSMAVLPRMLERGAGLLLFVSSTGGRIPIIHEAAYNGAKFGLCGFAEAAAVDLAGTGVDVKLVLPGPIDTDIWERPDNDARLFDIELVPAADCAAGIVDAMTSDRFEHYVPPIFPGGIDVKEMVVDKHRDCDAYVNLMGQIAQSFSKDARNP